MDEQVKALLSKYPDQVIELFIKIREIIYGSISHAPNETLWARLPSYYVESNFVRLIPFKDHINIEASQIICHKEKLTGYKITPKGMLQIYLNDEIPYNTLKLIFSETLGK